MCVICIRMNMMIYDTAQYTVHILSGDIQSITLIAFTDTH